MRGKLLYSALGVIGIFILSIVCYANAPRQVEGKSEYVSQTDNDIPNMTVPTTTETPQEETTTAAPTSTESTEQSKIGSTDWDMDDAYLLAKIAMAEAENQDTEGKALVILVVLNRVWDDKFPDTIREVIYQPNQFSPIANGRFDRVEPDEDCWRALELVQVQHWDKSRGATYFESKSESTWHSRHLEFLFQHGDHYFYKE